MRWLIFTALTILTVHSEGLPSWLVKEGAPLPPGSGIYDKSGFFNRDPAAYQRISVQLEKLAAERGYKIYLMVEPALIGTTAAELAAQLYPIWLPHDDGLVLVYESDSRSLGIGRDIANDSIAADTKVLIPTHEISSLITRTLATVDQKLAPEKYIETLSLELAAGSESFFKRRDLPLPADRLRKGLLVAALVVGLLAVAILTLKWLVKHSVMQDVPTFNFPNSGRPERLGAPCGASVTTHRFGLPSA